MVETQKLKVKVCLAGEPMVGKTSLIHRFASGAFDESYIRTLGAVVSKKSVALGTVDGRPVHVDMMILDIMGKRTFLQLFKDAYFSGARGILAVFDMTRKTSLRDLPTWINSVRETVGPIPVLALANKSDLTDRFEVKEAEISEILGPMGIRVVKTSAKTGENVEDAFVGLVRELTAAVA